MGGDMRSHAHARSAGHTPRVFGLILTLAVVVGSVLGVAGPVLGVYKGPCADGTQIPDAAHAFVQRTSTKNFAGAIGDAIIQDLLPCGGPSSSKFSYPLVLPANLQYTLNNSGGRIVQIGYENCHMSACNGVPNDGKNHFVFTASDHESGQLYLFGGALGPDPVTGDRYRFKIQLIDQDYWNFCIKDLSAGGSYSCEQANYTWPDYSSYAWYGTETQNTNAGMGNKGSDDIDMRWMQYLRVDLGAWWVADGNSCLTNPSSPYSPYWHCYITSTADTDGDGYINDSDTLRSHTHDH
jgi:hypothetical protein